MPQLTDAVAHCPGILLAVYAPFGSDETLSDYPDGSTHSLLSHPLVASLQRVAKTGVHVLALIDRVGDDTYLLDITAGQPGALQVQTRWKQDMRSPHTLCGFLLEAHHRHPCAALVLGLEGHGAGYLPELDTRRLSWNAVNRGTDLVWHISGTDAAPIKGSSLTVGGLPALSDGFPSTPGGNPAIPVNHQPMSTYSLGLALRQAQARGCPKLAVIHFDNCFNMSTEVLHTVAPYAHAADGFCNYGFFTAGQAYATAFEQLAANGGSTNALALARSLSLDTHALFQSTGGGYPAVGGAVALARMEAIVGGIDTLGAALVAMIDNGGDPARDTIQAAITKAQNYDTDAPLVLETPDQLTDIYSFAEALKSLAAGYKAVAKAAADLAALLNDIKTFGDVGIPAMDTTHKIVWDFSEKTLAMNIFLPDPLRLGLWDWRSSYYGDVKPEPFTVSLTGGLTQELPPAQTGVIDFFKKPNWVLFLKAYHLNTKFTSFHVGRIPDLPPFNPNYVPPKQGANGGGEVCGCPSVRQPRPLGPVGQWVAWLRGKTGKL